MFSRTTRLMPTLVLSLALALLPLLITSAAAQDPPVDEQVDSLLSRFGGSDLSRAWQGALALEALGDEAIPALQESLDSESQVHRLIAAKTLLSLGETEGVRAALFEVATNEELASRQRAAAIRLLSDFRDSRTQELLEELAEDAARTDPVLRVAVARTLHAVSRDREITRDLLLPLLGVDDLETRNAAALALAEMGLVDGKVKGVLRSLELEPTPEGSMARLLLERDLFLRRAERKQRDDPQALVERDEQELLSLRKKLEDLETELSRLQARSPSRTNHPLIDELLRRIQFFYADPDLVDEEELLIQAAKGMVRSLDPFSSFMDPKDTKQFNEGMTGEYAGIGAQVQKDPDTDYLKILRPIYQGPAYKVGLISEDKLTEVEGVSTQGLSLNEIVKKLKGVPGTPVTVMVYRRGWIEPREFVIERQLIQLESVRFTLLPGDIGFISLAQFGDTAIDEVESALDELEALGMKGLILDLRSNPGGYLQSAVDLVDNFVDDTSMPIVSQKSESDRFEATEKFATQKKRPDYPMVVLVNGSSASASEIVSGALQDFERASIIGGRTFGKGSVQRLLPLPNHVNKLLGGESLLRLTVQHYYLPSGRSIHTIRDSEGRTIKKGGVLPDIISKAETIPLWRVEAISGLIDKNIFNEFLDEYFTEHHATFEKIASDGDNGSVEAYPDFHEFFDSRNSTRALENDIRFHLRSRIRRMIEDERGEQFACDFNEDVQLQRAIVETLRKLNEEVNNYPQYETFASEPEAPQKL